MKTQFTFKAIPASQPLTSPLLSNSWNRALVVKPVQSRRSSWPTTRPSPCLSLGFSSKLFFPCSSFAHDFSPSSCKPTQTFDRVSYSNPNLQRSMVSTLRPVTRAGGERRASTILLGNAFSLFCRPPSNENHFPACDPHCKQCWTGMRWQSGLVCLRPGDLTANLMPAPLAKSISG